MSSSLPSRVQLLATVQTLALQDPLFTEFSRQEYWSGYPFPSPGDLPDPGIEPGSPALQADSLPSVALGSGQVKIRNLCVQSPQGSLNSVSLLTGSISN